jgi:hypothetical protein
MEDGESKKIKVEELTRRRSEEPQRVTEDLLSVIL